MNALRILSADQVQQFVARAGEDVADEGDVILLGDVVLAVDLGVARQRQPGRRGDPGPAEPIGPVALGGEDQVEAAGSSQARSKLRWVSMAQQADGRSSAGR